jgi:hypothetical protein
MNKYTSNQKRDIAREILSYLAEHPEAQDTLEGIAEWWLLERKIQYQARLIQGVVSELVDKGLVLECKQQDEGTHYRLNQDKREEIIDNYLNGL